MPRGKQKGYKKNSITIKDPVLEPFYIVNEDKQFILMKDSSTLPIGYYTTFANALKATVREVNMDKNAHKTCTIKEYIDQYTEVNESILNTIKL